MKLARKKNGNLEMLRLTLSRRGRPSFTLFPMVHVADRAFFRQVAREADAHDLVLKEGVRAAAGRTANRSHRIATAGHRTLAAQSRSMSESGGDHWINADLAPDKFGRHWRKLPLLRRALFHILLPVLSLFLRLPAARRQMIDVLAELGPQDDGSIDEIFGDGFHDAVVKRRDQALIDACIDVIDTWEEGKVAVVWGAAHIPPLVMVLMGTHGYRITSRQWITVMTAPGQPVQDVVNSDRA